MTVRVAGLPFFEITLVFVRFDHVASRIVNANQSIVGTAEKLRVADCVVRFNVQEPTECQPFVPANADKTNGLMTM